MKKILSLFLLINCLCLYSCRGEYDKTVGVVSDFIKEYGISCTIYSSLALEGEDGYIPTELCTSSPASACESVPMICNRVVFPAPLAPTIEISSPRFTSSVMPFSTSNVPKDLRILVTFIIVLRLLFHKNYRDRSPGGLPPRRAHVAPKPPDTATPNAGPS